MCPREPSSSAVSMCVCVCVFSFAGSIHRCIDAFIYPSIQTTHQVVSRFIDASKTCNVVVLSCPCIFFVLLCSHFVNLGGDLCVILSMLKSL